MGSFIDVQDLYRQKPPALGHELKKKCFAMDPEYANLNNGSYGTPPRPVLQAALELQHKIEKNPDLFHKITYQPMLIESRAQLAKFLNVQTDELVLVQNATTCVSTVLRNFFWEKDDVLIDFSTSYTAINRTMTYLHETPPFVKRYTVPLIFPMSNATLLEQFRAHLRSPAAQAGGPNNKRLIIIDSIASSPGVLLPWQEMVKICKEEKVWSVIDAAHSIGQEPGIDLTEAAPDFWFSNCHKWFMSTRSVAVLYIPFRNQHIIKTSLPTGNYYIPLADRDGDPNLQIQFEWFGTVDWTPFLTVPDAMAFRRWIGGEEKIYKYCHDLALKGGKLLAEMWGTQLLDPDGDQTATMVNVELPIPGDITYPPNVGEIINKRMLQDYKAFSAWYFHNGKWWTRCSAHVFNDISDFEKVGKAWLKIAEDLKTEGAFAPTA
ncbi:pyridoxal phosphate-dependent transferase [Coprinopsis sp. MPI-PUGE-AT-0042]|nr:pyridoxal phosphate-dependent transferase [Coprinopsis sp. MPI-PUGE-AT-0042]